MNNLTYGELKEIWDGQKNLGIKSIFINFYADWCEPCKSLELILDKMLLEYGNKVDFYKVDMEKESELSTIFEVTHIPHFIMISKDGGITPGAGAINEETIRYFIERLLSK